MDNRSNSRANTWEKTRLFGGLCLLGILTDGPLVGRLVSHDKCVTDRSKAARLAMDHSSFCPINFRRLGIGQPW